MLEALAEVGRREETRMGERVLRTNLLTSTAGMKILTPSQEEAERILTPGVYHTI